MNEIYAKIIENEKDEKQVKAIKAYINGIYQKIADDM
jgi:hypothetical protein